MTDKTHQLIGLTVASAVYFSQQPHAEITLPIAMSVLVGAVVGSLAPDIDQPTAGIWRKIPLVGGVVGQVVSEGMGGHRNLSHSLLGAVLFALLFRWIGGVIPEAWLLLPGIFVQSAMIGFISHLIADSVTVMGIPLLWPLGKNMGFPPRPFHGLRIVTGKWFENLVVFPLVLIIFGALLLSHKSQFCLLLPWWCS